MRRFALLVILLLPFSTLLAQSSDEARLMRFPTTNGSQVVFTHAGDLYTVPLAGGTARRLTSHVGVEILPKFSPNGQSIAFTAQYDGNTEVYTIPANGGNPSRLTHTATLSRDDISDRMGPNNIVMSWTPDGQSIIYRSRRHSFNAFQGQLYSVNTDGGLSHELPLSTGGFCSYSPNGGELAFNRVFREFRTWKYYAGGMADDVWIFNFDTKEVKNITNSSSQDIIPMWIGNEIYFLSDRYRTMNLFAYSLKTNETRQVTHFNNYDIKFPSHNGNTIVFEKGGYLYSFNTETQTTTQIPVTINNDFLYSRSEYVDASESIFRFDLSHDGARALFSARGDIFTVPAEEGITRNLTQNPGTHNREAVWSPCGKYIAYLSDQTGEYEIFIQQQDGSAAPVQLTSGDSIYKYSLRWSPDSKTILWTDRNAKLQMIDVETKSSAMIDRGEFGLIASYAWSPDSRWVAYSKQKQNRFWAIYLYNIDTQKRVAATDGWFQASQPAFSNDGKYLLYVSDRDFEPIYSRTEWNHAYRDMSRVYITMLADDTPSPFAPENNEVEIEKQEDDKESRRDREESNPEKTPEVRVDVNGLTQRTVALPHEPANYWNIHCINGVVYYNKRSSNGGSTIHLFNLKEKKEETIGGGMRYKISADGSKMMVKQGNRYAIVNLPSGSISLDKPIDLSGMRMWVDYKKEWQQIYDESWRQMRDFFYLENMHGLNWDSMYHKYNVLIPHINHRIDLTYVIGELIGELNVGHAYVNSGKMPTAERVNLGLLGARVSKHTSGYFRIDRILEGANWSKELRSPLLDVGVNVNEGDYIIAVDGQPLNSIKDIYQTLIGKADRTVELTVSNEPTPNGARRVLVVPTPDESALYYYSWVQNNIRKVSEATNGEVGYIHIPDMGPGGLNEFVKHFYPQLNKKGLIIDDRGNGGGNVSPMLLERLNRMVYRANMRRGFDHPSPIPNQTHIGPKVLLIDRYSASDGDLFAHGFRQMNIGTIIGTRSWGGVVGITASLPFVDGGDLRKPEFASFCSETGEWIIEGYGVDPDIELDNNPHLEYTGVDQQLNKAIEVILEQLKEWEGLPSIPQGPDKSE